MAARIVVEEVLDRDLECRSIDIVDDDTLYTLSTLTDSQWDYSLPTLVTNLDDSYRTNELSTNVSKFRQHFYADNPILSGIDLTNLLVAGGCIGHHIRSMPRKYEGDIDVFVYGLSMEQATDRIRGFTDALITRANEMAKITGKDGRNLHYVDPFFVKSENCITLTFGRSISLKIQIILRLYTTKSEILHGFDMGSSAVGFDGQQVYFTGLGKLAYEYQCNVVDTTRRSNTYEHRLQKYYERGFKIILPHLDISKLRTQYHRYQMLELCELPLFTFSYSRVSGNMIIVRELKLRPIGNGCDYAPIDEICENDIVPYNIKALLDNRKLYSRTRKLTSKIFDMPCYLTEEHIDDFYQKVRGDLLRPAIKKGLMVQYITVESAESLIEKIYIKNLKAVDVITPVINSQISLTKALLREYISDKNNLTIIWRTENPGGQDFLLTGSISPIIEDVTKWYGQYYIESCLEIFDSETEALLAKRTHNDESVELSEDEPLEDTPEDEEEQEEEQDVEEEEQEEA